MSCLLYLLKTHYSPKLMKFIGIVSILLNTGCSAIYFHSDERERDAKFVLETFEKIDLNSVVITGRSNVEALTKAQREVDQSVTNLASRRDLIQVLGFTSNTESCSDNQVIPTGWNQLVCETSKALKVYGLTNGETLKLEDKKAAIDFTKIHSDRR